MNSPDFDDLAAAAEVTRDATGRHCTPLCHAYHTVWPYMRLYGVLPSVARDHQALSKIAAEAARSGMKKILISGAADFGILAYMIDGYARAGRIAEVTVTDLCGAPLELNRWYAARKGWAIATVEGDIRAFSDTGFDLVIAHNFLNFFDTAARRDVASSWARALRPSGELALFASIRQGAPAASRRFGPKGLDALVKRTFAAKMSSPYTDIIADELLEELVREFGEKRIRNSLQSFEAIRDPLDHAELEIVRVTPGERPLQEGVVSDGQSERLHVTARKRGS